MKEREALSILDKKFNVRDDCGVIEYGKEKLLITTDMLRRSTHIPDGIYNETIGWRAIAVSLSDISAMGGEPTAAVLAIGTSKFEEIEEIANGAYTICDKFDTQYIGGDIIRHKELTLTSSVLGKTKSPIYQSGAKLNHRVCITGKLGRTALALQLLKEGKKKKSNKLFKFSPRISEGKKIAEYASSMTDISDGLSSELNKLAKINDIGFEIKSKKIPLIKNTKLENIFVGGDYELLFTLPPSKINKAKKEIDFSIIGKCTETGIKMDGKKLKNRGYEH